MSHCPSEIAIGRNTFQKIPYKNCTGHNARTWNMTCNTLFTTTFDDQDLQKTGVHNFVEKNGKCYQKQNHCNSQASYHADNNATQYKLKNDADKWNREFKNCSHYDAKFVRDDRDCINTRFELQQLNDKENPNNKTKYHLVAAHGHCYKKKGNCLDSTKYFLDNSAIHYWTKV